MPTLTRDEWKAKAAEMAFPTQAFIGGKFVDAAAGATYDVTNPATGKLLARVASCEAGDVNRAVSVARGAFESGVWSDVAPAQRKAVLFRLVDLLMEHRDELGLLISLEMGKLIGDAVDIEVPLAASVLQWHAEAADKAYGEIAPTSAGDLALISREPLGVVGAIVPWNFPLNLAIWKLAPALIAGNCVVLKPSERSPLSSLKLAELAASAGVPEGVLSVLPGFGPTAGRPLGLHADVDCISFTGSTAVGKQLLAYASESNMKQIWLECGGKSPNLVFADCADLDLAAAMTCSGVFFNQGEVCSSNSRLLVQRSIKDRFLGSVLERAREIRPGDPLDPTSKMGALVDERHTQSVLSYIEEGRHSATLALGGSQVWVNGSGCFVEPTVFDEVPPDARIAQEEIFGPVLSVISFETEEEAIQIANSTVYGLAASVWTGNLSRAHRVARKLRVGTVSLNTVDALSPFTPFGGVRQSGAGRDLSLHALDKYTALKTTWIKY